MKRNSLTKGLVISVALSAFLTGCGSVTSSNNDSADGTPNNSNDLKATSISGKAIDGYLQYATVCLDLNKDGYCQSTEPMSTTEKDGSFKLDISADIQTSDEFNEAMLLVYGGKDNDTGVDFRGKLLAAQDSKVVNISPISTLVAKAVQSELKDSKKLSKDEMKKKVDAKKEQVAEVLGLEVADLVKDPVAEKDNNPKLIKESLKIQKAVEGVNIDGDNDALEKAYEKLAEKIEDANDANDLLDKAFENESGLANVKIVNQNIDKAFEKKLDLEKIANIIKEDLRRIKKDENLVKILDDDEKFQDDFDWEKEYIKSGLKDVGIDEPSDDQIDKIKEKVGNGQVKPNVLDDMKEELKDSDDNVLNNIYDFVKKDEAKKEKEREIEKAKKDGKTVKFEKGMTLYSIDSHSDKKGYEEIHINDNNTITFNRYMYDNKIFTEDTSEDRFDVEFVLKSGVWVERAEKPNELRYTLDSDGKLNLPDHNRQVALLNQKDISNKEVYIESIDGYVSMPEGAKESYLGFKVLHTEYVLDRVVDGITGISTLEDFVAQKCDSKEYMAKDKGVCNSSMLSGFTKYGKWEIKTVENAKVLVEEYGRDSNIYAVKGGQLYTGWYEQPEFDKDPEPSYNKVAIDAIKSYVIDTFSETNQDYYPEGNIIDSDLTTSLTYSNHTLTVVFSKDMNPTTIGTWTDTKTLVINLDENLQVGMEMFFKAQNFQTTEGKYLAEDLKFTIPNDEKEVVSEIVSNNEMMQ